MSDIGYDLNEDDIERMIGILKILDQSNANADTAISFLVYMKKNARDADPDKLEEFYSEFRSTTF